ncbi:hypothetical protein DMC14_000750 [Metamycoplasma phocicerebrale]|uniref:Rho termination factor N-terminal domain-containing protein n=1 Tax=Metamycoplasma phocicerebrale TaxID=142649 RepID=A0A3T0TTA0_9BACT|nr:hypothetical protein [Metamycoplasma phocicerebrale]AZZ65321.1 hypothetical protein DMC14_000750 [Metamycoplasma phocicerebrale]
MRDIDLTTYSTTDQLYEDHKKKFSIRWILFTIFLSIVTLLLLTIFIEYAVRKESYIQNYLVAISQSNSKLTPTEVQGFARQTYVRTFIISLFSMLLGIAILAFHLVFWIKSLKAKDFSVYSPWLSSIYAFLIFIVAINLFWGIGSLFNIQIWNINRILNLVYTIALPIGYFVFYWPCGKIIKMFRYVKIQAQMQNSGAPNFESFAQMMQQENSSKISNNIDQAFISTQADINQKNNINYRDQLNSLDNEKLILMANKLNIFGAEDLPREKLIDKIILIFETNEQNKNSNLNKKNSIEKNLNKDLENLDSSKLDD